MGYTTGNTQLMIGLGMSSISDSWYGFAQNSKSLKEYLSTIEKGQLAVFKGHKLTNEDLMIRQQILNLMCKFETTWDDKFKDSKNYKSIMLRLKPLIIDGLAIIEGNSLLITELGKVFVRNICMCFDVKLKHNLKYENIFSKTI